MGTRLTFTPHELSEEAKSVFKIKGDYSFFAIPTDVLKKNNIESFVLNFDNGVVSPVQAQGTNPPEKEVITSE